jgi:hypothetical protein
MWAFELSSLNRERGPWWAVSGVTRAEVHSPE